MVLHFPPIPKCTIEGGAEVFFYPKTLGGKDGQMKGKPIVHRRKGDKNNDVVQCVKVNDSYFFVSLMT